MRQPATIHKGQAYLDGTLKSRQARPLNGLEVREAVERHLLSLTDKLLNREGLLSNLIIDLTNQLKEDIRITFSRRSEFQKVHVTYPSIGWNVKTRLEKLSEGEYRLSAEVELDIGRNKRLALPIGTSGAGEVVGTLEDEKIPTVAPDKDRQTFGLPITAEYVRPDGTTGIADLRELRRAAKVVDVGSGALDREARLIPVDNNGVIGTTEVMMVAGDHGQPIVTPKDLPEVNLDDVVATPPTVPREPLTTPLPARGSMNKVERPGVKFKETK